MKSPIILRRVVGHSMEPTLEQGKVVFATPLFDFKRGDVVVARIGQREIVKRISEINEGKFTLAGDNPDHSRDSRSFGTVEESQLLGRVIPRPKRTRCMAYKT